MQGFAASVKARGAALAKRLAPFGRLEETGVEEGAATWEELRTLAALTGEAPLWRVVVPPAEGGALVRRLEAAGADWALDWAGGLAWLTLDDAEAVRMAASRAGGHATLVRGTAALRERIPAFHPQPAGLAALEARVRRAFDPAGVFELERF
ncbi:MAG: hypothetical protein EOP73_31330 [Variovorax sp.]|nr:MAG: hypothetical protein EOP73_31330 [Variovorax sp.]